MLKYLETHKQPFSVGNGIGGVCVQQRHCDYRFITNKARVMCKREQSIDRTKKKGPTGTGSQRCPLLPTDALSSGLFSRMIKFKHFIALVTVDWGFCTLYPYPMHTPLNDIKKQGSERGNKEGKKG